MTRSHSTYIPARQENINSCTEIILYSTTYAPIQTRYDEKSQTEYYKEKSPLLHHQKEFEHLMKTAGEEIQITKTPLILKGSPDHADL